MDHSSEQTFLRCSAPNLNNQFMDPNPCGFAKEIIFLYFLRFFPILWSSSCPLELQSVEYVHNALDIIGLVVNSTNRGCTMNLLELVLRRYIAVKRRLHEDKNFVLHLKTASFMTMARFLND